MKADILTPDERKLFEDISVTVIALWKHAPYMRAWYSDNICRLHENLLLNAKDSRFAWGEIYIKASTTIH